MNEFRREYLEEWSIDDTYDTYFRAWVAYHEAADRIDGGLRDPGPMLKNMAVSAGLEAMRAVLGPGLKPGFKDPTWEKWQRAKLDAVRMVERNRSRGVKR